MIINEDSAQDLSDAEDEEKTLQPEACKEKLHSKSFSSASSSFKREHSLGALAWSAEHHPDVEVPYEILIERAEDCVFIHGCIWMYIYMDVRIYMYIHVYIYAYLHVDLCTYMAFSHWHDQKEISKRGSRSFAAECCILGAH